MGPAGANTRVIARSAAVMAAGAILIGLVEQAVPGGPSTSLAPTFAALALAPLTAVVGPRLPRRVLGLLGPIGAALIAYALQSTHGSSDGAVMYMWPVLWMAHFYGRGGTVLIVACVAVAHGVALASMPPGVGNVDRWIDVVVSVAVVAGVVRLLSERAERLFASLAAEARIDALTGLLNRRGFEERVAPEVARAVRERTPLAFVAFDLDHFKSVNDLRGHEAGDRALVAVAEAIVGHVRASDVAARWGGEEFVVVLPGADAEAARGFADRVRAAVAAADADLTISAGVAAADGPLDPRALLAAADDALYTAKRAGRDRTVVAAAPAVARAA